MPKLFSSASWNVEHFGNDPALTRAVDFLSKADPAGGAKTANLTFANGSWSSTDPADLDHVFLSQHLKFKQFKNGAEVVVRGWPEKATTPEKDQWISDFSDHALIYREVHV